MLGSTGWQSRPRGPSPLFDLISALLARAGAPQASAALRLARAVLSPLEGTGLVAELDAQLSLLPAAGPPAGLDRVGKPKRAPARVVAAIELAMKEGRQLSVRARTAAHGGEERDYVLDPLRLRMVGDELYLLSWSHARQGARTFKVARIVEAAPRDERAEGHPKVDVEEAAFRGAVKAWGGERVSVRLRGARAMECTWPMRHRNRRYRAAAPTRRCPQRDAAYLAPREPVLLAG